jgi:acetyl esterase/lipase
MRTWLCTLLFLLGAHAFGADPIRVWPGLAPGETTELPGEKLPPVEGENPPVTRVVKISAPTFTVHLAPQPNGSAVLILPGGGFGKVVPDKEGTEAAEWLNGIGISAFVLSYRTQEDPRIPGWVEPLQDAQRTLALIRSQADAWNLKRDQIGLLGFSAGGQVAARLLGSQGKLMYEQVDLVDTVSHRPDFALLVYPWNMIDPQTNDLAEGITVSKYCPPTYLVHTDDDRSSSLGPALFYAGLKRTGIPAELHVFGNGGHGYGLRPVPGSQISTWTELASHWLRSRKIATE